MEKNNYKTKEIIVGANQHQEVLDFASQKKSFLPNQVKIKAYKNSFVRYILVVAGKPEIKKDILVEVNEGARVEIIGLVFGDDSNELDIVTALDHKFANSKGDIKFRSVLKDKARLSYQGLIKVHPKAVKTDTYLDSRALVLGSRAHLDAEPKLEIATDDVKASHSFAQSALPLEQIFYLESRGVSKVVAKRMIIRGFLAEVLKNLSKDKQSEIWQLLNKFIK